MSCESDETNELVNAENHISASFELYDIYRSNEPEEIEEPEIINLDY